MSPTDTASEVKFEIGHVLFIDIVAYSQLLITQQSQQLDALKRIVRGTEQLRAAEAKGSCCDCQQAMAERWCFALRRKRRFYARSRSPGN